MRDAMLLAERDHLLKALNTQPRLFGTGLVVKARVEDAAVTTAGMEPAGGLLLEQRDRAVFLPALELEGEREAEDAAAHHQEVRRPRSRHGSRPAQAWAGSRASVQSSRRRRGMSKLRFSAWTLW